MRSGEGGRATEAPGATEDADAAAAPDPPLGTPWVRPDRRWLVTALLIVVPPLLAFGAVRVGFAQRTGAPVTDMSGDSWGRWDTGNYADIAEHGYYYGSCAAQGRALHGDTCSPAAWYPAFPYLGRWLTDLTHWSLDTSFVVIAQASFLVLLGLVWGVVLRARITIGHVALLVLAACFPGGVYLLAEFPMALLTVLLTAMMLSFVRDRWILGAVFGALASLCYPITAVLPLTAMIWCALATATESRRRQVTRTLAVGGIVAAGTIAVFAFHQATIGNWHASIDEQRRFGGTLFNPVLNWWHTVLVQDSWIQLTYPATARVIAAVTVLATIVVATCIAVVVLAKDGRTRHDIGALVMLIGLWVLPLSTNIDTGLYRRLCPMLPAAIILLRRAPWPVTVTLSALSAGVWFWMVPKFYSGALI